MTPPLDVTEHDRELRSAAERAAAQRPARQHSSLVVADPRLVVREEDLGHEITPAAHAGFLEYAFEVLLDGVGRDDEPLGDLHCRLALERAA